MTYVYGTDQSHYQPPGTASGSFLWIKVSQGASIHDAAARMHYASHATAPRGPYHFYDFGASPEKNAANFLATTLKVAPLDRWELPPMVDVERGGHGAPADTAELLTAMALVQRDFNRVPLLYTGGWWNAAVIDPDPGFAWYPLWDAAYPSKYADGFPPPDSVPMPAPKPPWTVTTVWQYSDTNGTLDRDRMTAATLASLLGQLPPSPSPSPSTGGFLMALNDAQQAEVYAWLKDLHAEYAAPVDDKAQPPHGNKAWQIAKTFLSQTGTKP